MKRLISCIALFVSCLSAYSQKAHFIYLQTEQEQSFFVKMSDKIYSSSGSGYLILSKLRDSTYHFKIGFPENKWPEQQFTVPVRGSDRGFLLKNFGDKGWGLYDLQTLSIQMGNDAGEGKARRSESREVSEFTEVLSRAANDPSLKEAPIMVKAEDKPLVAQQAIVKAETATPKQEPATKDEVKKEETVAINKTREEKKEAPVADPEKTVVAEDVITSKKEEKDVAINDTPVAAKKEEVKTEPNVEYRRSAVVKKGESSTSEGVGAVYVDQDAEGRTDTIRILIPNQKSTVTAVAERPKEQPKEQKEFLDLSTADKDMTPVVVSSRTAPIGSMDKPVVKPKCPFKASENDFLKLRKRMAGEKNDQAMIAEARKSFRARCFSTEQVRNLGNLFLKEAGKFQFYEVAYTSVTDVDHFKELEAEFKDPYFVHRMKNLVN